MEPLQCFQGWSLQALPGQCPGPVCHSAPFATAADFSVSAFLLNIIIIMFLTHILQWIRTNMLPKQQQRGSFISP